MHVYPCVRKFFPLATMAGGFQESTVAFAKPYFYSLGFLCATGCSTPYWSYSTPPPPHVSILLLGFKALPLSPSILNLRFSNLSSTKRVIVLTTG